MKRTKIIAFICVCLVMSFSLFAQKVESKKGKWNGDIDLILGNDFHKSIKNKRTNNQGEFKARINYASKKYNFEVSTDIPYSHRIAGKLGRNYSKVDQDTSLAYDDAMHEYTNYSNNSSVRFQWKPNLNHSFAVSYKYEHYNNNSDNYNLTTEPFEDEFVDFSFSKENVRNYGDINNVGFSYQYHFSKPGRIISVDWNGVFSNTSNFSETMTGKGTGEIKKGVDSVSFDKKYRNTPYSNNNDHILGVSFVEQKLFNVSGLSLDCSMRANFCKLLDRSRASTLIDGQWVDSTSVREDFRYKTLTCTPNFKITYNPGKYSLSLSYSPETYIQSLDGLTQKGGKEKGSLAHEIDFISRFDLGKGNVILYAFSRREDRPSYLQMCWFPRHTGNMNANEIYQGDPNLSNSVRTTSSISYQLTYKRFSVSYNLDFRYDPRKIESTYRDDSIDGREYRIYTWVNGGKSFEIKNGVDFSWNGEHFHANLGGSYTIYKGISIEGSVTRSGNYYIYANAEYRTKTWIFNMSADYQSDIVRSYTSMTSIIGCNVKVSKTFGKHFSAYLEGKNLLDRKVTTTIKSEDETSLRIDENRNNKRIFVLGINYHF